MKHSTQRTLLGIRGVTKMTSSKLGIIVAGALIAAAPAMAELPSMKFMTAPLVDPTTALGYYTSAVVHSVSIPGQTRAAEIKELAIGLGKGQVTNTVYAQRVYEYVYNNIRFTPTFGLTKGPLGALVDQAGTSFDQASLMVELLREKPITANYQIGTITLTPAQVSAWLGMTDAAATCRLLADGGIPATVNGSSNASCAVSGTVTGVTMLQVWVSALGNLYDPSFKVHTFKTGIDLSTATQCGANLSCTGTLAAARTQATSAATSTADQTAITGSTNTIRNVAQSSLESQLTTWSMNLKARIDAQYPNSETADIVGGQVINPAAMPAIGAALPYGSPTPAASWTEIPDKYRTTLRIQYDSVNYTVYADETGGRRIRLAIADFVDKYNPNIYNQPYAGPGPALDRDVRLLLERQELAGSYRKDASPLNDLLVLAADHPYAANSGTYMDETIASGIPLAPVLAWAIPGDGQEGPLHIASWAAAIVQGFGQSGSSAVAHYSAMNAKEVLEGNLTDTPRGATCVGHHDDLIAGQNYRYSQIFGANGVPAGDPEGCDQSQRFTRVAQLLAETSRVSDLVGAVNSSVILHHHSIGAIVWNNGVNVESSVSTISKINSVGDRRATNYSFAVLSSRLEGGTAEQTAGAWDGESAVSSMARANEKHLRYGRFDTVSGFNASGLYPPASSQFLALVNSHIAEYLNAGYAMTVPESTELQFPFPRYRWVLNTSTFAISYVPETTNMLVHWGMLGIHPSSSDATVPDRIAFLVEGYGGLFKGAASDIEGDDPLKAVLQTAKLQDSSVKNRKYFGIDTGSGSLRLTPQADLVTGLGSFPMSLAFQRNYDSNNSDLPSSQSIATPFETLTDTLVTSAQRNEEFLGTLDYSPDASKIGGGWDHNWHITAEISSDAFQGMGEDSPIDAVGTLTALNTLRALTSTTPTFLETTSSVYVGHWFGSLLNDNTVVVKRPPSSSVFVKLPNGSFNPENASAEILTQTNVKVAKGATSNGSELLSARFDYRDVQFTLKGREGSQLSFNFGAGDVTPNDTLGTKLFKATSWTFPTGAQISFAYAIGKQPFCLTSVSNNAGRTLNFANETPTYASLRNGTLNPAPHGQCYLHSVTDENGRTVTFARPGATNALGQGGNAAYFGGMYQMPELRVTTPDGATTRYVYSDNINADLNTPDSVIRLRRVIGSVYSPSDLNNAFLSFSYDSLSRVKTHTDALGQVTNYSVGSYGGERLHRGESKDPLTATVTGYFNHYGRAVQSIDAIGRVTSSVYDGRQRLSRVVYPELNELRLGYDVRSNETSRTERAKPGSTLPDVVTSTTYGEGAGVAVGSCVNSITCNMPASSIDALGRTTSYGYNSTTGQLTSITRPAVAEGTPQSNFCYTPVTGSGAPISLITGAVTKVSSTENRVVTYAYGGTKIGLSSATIDPANSLTAACAPTTKAGPLNLTTAFTFDTYGNVRTVDGPRSDVSDVTTYTFDSMRRLTRTDAPLNSVTRYTYDLDGMLRTTRQAAVANPVDSNPANPAPTDLVAAQWKTETRNYLANGDLSSVTDPESNQIQYGYDAVGRPRLITDADGLQTAAVYDLAGEELCTWRGGTGWTAATAPSNCAWTPSSYTGTGAVRYSAFLYSPNGKEISVQDAGNNTTAYVYDKHDRLRYLFFPNPSTGALCSAPSSEDGSASPTCSGTAPNVPTYEEFWYSANGLAASAPCSASGSPCRKRTRSAQTVAVTYDALDRESTKSPTGQATVTTTYNLLSEVMSVGKPASGSFGAHTTTYAYDGAGRQSSETDTTNSRSVSYLYNNASQRVRTTWPDGYFVTYDFDALGRPTYVKENGTTELAYYKYDILSRRDYLCLGGQSVSCLSGAGTNKTSYTYESDSDLDVLTQVLNSTVVTLDYGSNHSHQVTSLAANDNFYLPRPTSPSNVAYVPNALNQYGSVSGQTSTYDANGNLLTWFPVAGKQTYTFDSENRLVTAAVDGSSTATISYDYDALGRRASKTVNGTTTTYLLDGGEEIAEYSGATLLRRYVTGSAIDERIAHIEGTGGSAVRTYYHVNHQGSVVAMTDATGSIAARFAYDAYGRLAAGASTTGEEFRFTGRRFDSETGLYYYRARYYSPDLGRFLQTDPIGYADDMNLYAYTSNDPLNNSDPSGTNMVPDGTVTCDTDHNCTEVGDPENLPVIEVAAKKHTSGMSGPSPMDLQYNSHAILVGAVKGLEVVHTTTEILEEAPARQVGRWVVDSQGNKLFKVREHLSKKAREALAAKLAKNRALVAAAKGVGSVAKKAPFVEALFSAHDAVVEFQNGETAEGVKSGTLGGAAICTAFCPPPFDAVSLGIGITITIDKLSH